MVLHIIAFAAGVWLLQQQSVLPELRLAWLLPPAALLAAVLRGDGVWRRFSRGVLTLGCCAAAGFLWAAACAHWRLLDHLPPERESRDMVVTGVVAGLPQPYDRSVRFEFDVEQVQTPEAVAPKRIVLSWWGGGGRDGAPLRLPEIHAGERWQLTVRLKRPHGLANPHGFDYEAWLLERGIRATGYVRPKSGARRLDAAAPGLAYRIEALRERLRQRIRATLADAPAAGIIVALAMGDQRAIPPEQWQVFTRTGVNHLMSISGLHVTMLSGLAFALAMSGAAALMAAVVMAGGAGFTPHLLTPLRGALFGRILSVGLVACAMATIANLATILVTARIAAHGPAAVAGYCLLAARRKPAEAGAIRRGSG